MRSMTPWEKEEYDRRRGNDNSNVYSENKKEIPIEPNEDLVDIEDPVLSNYEENDGNFVVDDMEDLLKTIYNDIVKEAMKVKQKIIYILVLNLGMNNIKKMECLMNLLNYHVVNM